MTERPIIFSGPMVRAILAGTKTQTRRPVTKPIVLEWLEQFLPEFVAAPENHLCPYGYPGERLWVRETFLVDYDASTQYRASHPSPAQPKWTPSIHMPRAACRLRLEVTGARIERLQDITQEDAEAEGVTCDMSARTFVDHYRILWDSLNAKRAPWSSNPWVWVIEFKREGKC